MAAPSANRSFTRAVASGLPNEKPEGEAGDGEDGNGTARTKGSAYAAAFLPPSL